MKKMKTKLCSIFEKYKSDKCPAVYHTYSPVYYKLLKDIRYTARHVLEIGIGTIPLMEPISGSDYIPGASIKGWRDFFPNANIFAIDIDESVLFTEPRIFTSKVDQSSTNDLRSFVRDLGITFDFIIDDGSHIMEHQIISACELSKYLNPGGIYIIEDVKEEYLSSYDIMDFPGLIKIHTHIGDKDSWDNFIAYVKE